MRSKGQLLIVLTVLFGVLTSACGLVNKLNAVKFYGFAEVVKDCHWEEYEASISPLVYSQCTSCHGGGGSGTLVLSTSTTDVGKQFNYLAILSFIDTGVGDAALTALMMRISSSSSTSHPYKFSAGSSSYSAYSGFTQRLISDPSCTGNIAVDPF